MQRINKFLSREGSCSKKSNKIHEKEWNLETKCGNISLVDAQVSA